MGLQIVELHFSAQPKLDYLAVKERAEALLGNKIDTPKSNSGDVVLFYHQEHPVQLKDATIYPQTVLMQVDKPIDIDGYTKELPYIFLKMGRLLSREIRLQESIETRNGSANLRMH